MRNLRTEDEIIANWKGDIDKPVVSICCITYNQKTYIEDALEGFLIQETDFPFEILIHDDASTDRTAEIIREYEAKYPRLIKAIYQIENQYKKSIKATTIIFPKAKGKYIAFCEGDDYWQDCKKIFKQKNYLENEKGCAIVCHESMVVNEEKEIISEFRLPEEYRRDFSQDEMKKGIAWILTNTMMFINVDVSSMPERSLVLGGDFFIFSLLSKYGGSHFMANIKPSVYTVHKGGVWSLLNDEIKDIEKLNSKYILHRYYKRISEKETSDYYYNQFKKHFLSRQNTYDLIKELMVRSLRVRDLRKIMKLYDNWSLPRK